MTAYENPAKPLIKSLFVMARAMPIQAVICGGSRNTAASWWNMADCLEMLSRVSHWLVICTISAKSVCQTPY